MDDGSHTSLPADVAIVVSTGAETLPPEVLFTVPADGATEIKVLETQVYTNTYNPIIMVQFTEPISVTTVTTDTFFIQDQLEHRLSGVVTYDGALNRASFTPGESLVRGRIYTATVTTAVHDTSGNPMSADYAWSFGTEGYKIYLPLLVKQN